MDIKELVDKTKGQLFHTFPDGENEPDFFAIINGEIVIVTALIYQTTLHKAPPDADRIMDLTAQEILDILAYRCGQWISPFNTTEIEEFTYANPT